MSEQHHCTEAARLAALRQLAILDTPAEERFDRYTRLAAAALRVPIAAFVLVDAERQWFKSRVGLDACATPRSIAFCSHAIAAGDTLVVPDARLDQRFCDNPLVTGAPGVRAYAGQPVCGVGGEPLGTLCVIDTVPRVFDAQALRLLRDLAALVQEELNRDLLVRARDAAEAGLRELNEHLEARVLERTRALHDNNELLRQEIARREQVESSLRHSKKRVRNVIDTCLAAFVGIDEEQRITEWNPAAEKLFGWSRAEALGQNVGTLIVPARLRERHDAGMARFQITGDAAMCSQLLELPALTRAGDERIVEMSINHFEVDGQRFLAAFVQDVSARIAAQQALRAKEQLLDAVLEAVDVGGVACDAAGAITLFNRAARKLHNLPPAPAGVPPSLPDGRWFGSHQLRQPGSLAALPDDMVPLRRALRGESVVNVPVEVVVADMKPRLTLASGRPLTGPRGERLGAVVAINDVTDLAESRGRIVESEERLRTIADNVPALIAYIGPDLRYRFANERYADWLGLDPAAMLGRTVAEAMGELFYGERRAALEACMAGSARVVEGEVRRYGHSRVIRSSYIPHVRDGVVLGAYVFSTDMTAAREHERQLHALAHTDHLTGLPNRRAHEQRLAQAIDRAHRNGSALALASLDVDHFKQINDTLGHGAGDAVLREFGQRLAASVRVTDAVARLAGDEFVIVLEQVHTAAECATIGRKLLDAIRPSFFVEGRILPVTASIGIGWSARPERRTLAEAADRALYRTKEAGRDGVSVEQCRDG
ncbi:diguanylate cyclase domain-containing protein [Massilia sp. YMA4]|uniref:sensor domain-containing diguanylate cyclase n=1 Tax=Massilia sp. YMA4 TaxID=1593482 RepID=UPI000DD176BB|nr:diguanylate cyclase [Massilia sp. YMA4]AXA91120.1 hypothetical protein DPH57_08075 [Massilia sp. YMA4]